MPTGRIDHLTGMSASIGSDHVYIHEGLGYVLCGSTASIAAAGVEHISFKTPPITAGKVIHFRPAHIASSANIMSITMTESAVMTGGTKATPQNLNRTVPNTSKVEAYTGATLTTAGTDGIIYIDSVGSGGGSLSRSGGGLSSEEERVLKPDTMYSITFTNTGAATATTGTYTLFWYEE